MHVLTVCYGRPADPAAFDAYYTSTHVPLAEKIPGLASFTYRHCDSLDGSQPAHHLLAELIFASRRVADGMIGSMTRQKIAITLPEEQVAAARQAVAEGRAASVSAFISQALARRDADEELAETIAEIYAESGQPTEEDRLWARRVLGIEP
jgi:uncharacterized protein (TIGR02118 family)